MEPKLLVVGGGRMGGALVHGLLGGGWSPSDIVVVEPSAAIVGPSSPTSSRASRSRPTSSHAPGAAVLAVKPAVGEEACRALSSVGVGRVLSIMAGVPLDRLESWLPRSTAVVRAMPNTPATVGAGISALAAGSRATEPDLAWAEELLGAVGHVVRLPETSLDAVTGLSGSGPAYVFLVVEALIEAGMAVGLSEEVSRAPRHRHPGRVRPGSWWSRASRPRASGSGDLARAARPKRACACSRTEGSGWRSPPRWPPPPSAPASWRR